MFIHSFIISNIMPPTNTYDTGILKPLGSEKEVEPPKS